MESFDWLFPQVMELRLTDELRDRLDRLVTDAGRSTDEVVQEALTNYFVALAAERDLESRAYHEAGHVVVAALQRLGLRKRGLRIDEKGVGLASVMRKEPDGSTDVGDDPWRTATIIVAYAGHCAQRRFYPDCDPSSESCDKELAVALENEMYSEHSERCRIDAELKERSKSIVDEHWHVIEALGKALWAKHWAPQWPADRRWSHQYREKSVEREEVVSFLSRFGISAVLAEV